MKWIFAWLGLGVALGFAGLAFFYNPPTIMQRFMLQAVARQSVWAIRVEGTLEQGSLYLDLLTRTKGSSFARISYPPLKLLNNQWIELNNSFLSSSPFSPFLPLQLTKRLTTLRNLWRRQERFEFALNVPQLVQGTGTLWIDARTRLPQQATLEVARSTTPATLRLTFAYQDPTFDLPLNARPLAEVLAQLEQVVKARNGKPKKLSPLGEARTASAAFTHDFDHDGLSDALELFYGTDPANPDTDNDTHLDGLEVEQGYDPLSKGTMNKE